MTDSVAHDLRSPLTRLKSRLELALRDGPEDGESQRAALERAIAETDGILSTFATLMEIAPRGIRARPASPRRRSTCAPSVADIVELYAPLAEEKGLAIDAALDEAGDVAGHGQFHLPARRQPARQRARLHAGRGTDRALSRDRAPSGGVRLTVEDSGPGIPPEEREHVLAALRAPRCEPQPAAAAGLGLSLVAGVASLHRAELALDESRLGGLRVTLTFPPPAA